VTTAPASALSDAELTVLGLTFLGYYSPKSKDKNKSDGVSALKTFQKKSGLKQTGKISSATQLALMKAVSAQKPVTKQSLAIASLLLDSAKRLMDGDKPAPARKRTRTTGSQTIESQIHGDFEGWEGETIVKLTNGQVWQQTEYYYHYHYAFMPKVTILRSGVGYKMIVDGVPKAIGVQQLK